MALMAGEILFVDTKMSKFYNPLYENSFSLFPLRAVRIPKAIELQREAPLRDPSALCCRILSEPVGFFETVT